MNRTVEKIHDVAYQLAAQGVWPTVNNVRETLGFGSNTTINNELKVWRQNFLSKISTASRRPDWPPVLIESVEKLWQEACVLAETHLDNVKQEVLQEKNENNKKIQEMQKIIEIKNFELQTLHAEQDTLTQELVEARKLILQLEQKKIALESSQLALQEANSDLHRVQQEQMAHFTQQIQEQQQQNEHLVVQWQAKLQEQENIAYDRLEALREHLYQQTEHVRTQFQKEKQQLEATIKKLTQEHQKEKQMWQEQMFQRIEQSAQEQARWQALIEKLPFLEKENERLQKHNESLQHDLNSALANFNNLANVWKTQQVKPSDVV